ncbi:MAG: aldo/keto reductase [Coriobacteriia bacterium]|nr:aldo/keto reductase [Coriobacteriia bacterium]
MSLTIESTVTLANGVQMPLFGLGTYKTVDPGDIRRSVLAALAAGYRSIDTASMYGNEEGIAAALRESGVPREQVFLTTKLWNDNQGYDTTLAALHHSLERLGTDHVDLYLVHWPILQYMEATWVAMEEILERGEARAIGVCNHLRHHLEQLLDHAAIAPMVNQIEYHPWLQQPDLLQVCGRLGIAIEAWGPLMRGHLAEEPALSEVGARHGKSAAQVALRWALQNGVSVIPKAVHEERVRENAVIFDFELSISEMAQIDILDRGARLGRHPDETWG